MTAPVTLYVYDLSNGVAKTISPFILGRRIEGLWHTAIVIFGNEYFFGGHGIACCVPGSTQLGPPLKQELLGLTAITQDVFEEYLIAYSSTRFHGSSYNLLENNCNNFSDEVAKFLVGTGIDKNIVSLPQKVLSSPLGPLLRPHLEKMSNVAPTDARSLKKSEKTSQNGSVPSSSSAHCSSNSFAVEASWERSSSLYVPSFEQVQLESTDIEVLKKVDPALPKSIERGPFTTDDLQLLLQVYGTDEIVFMRVIALLAQKSGFVRLALEDTALFTQIKGTLTAGDNPACELLSNNLLAGVNQADKCDESIISIVATRIVRVTLVDADLTKARTLYNLSGSSLTEDQVMELGSALIFSLPDKAVDNEDEDKLHLLLKSLYLLMIKSRQVADLCCAMDKDVSIFRNHPILQGVVDKIIEIQKPRLT